VVRRSATTQVIDDSGGKDAATAKWFADFFGVSVTTPNPTATPIGGTPSAATPAAAGSGGVVVVLGQDEESAFLNTPGVGR
jgi:hypothetical protein